ncbi:hypothetical protein A6R68_17899, partial [Neotoma lepida]
MTKAIRVPPLQMPYKELSPAPASQLSSRAAQGPSPSLASSWTGLPRQPISISGLLQRQCAGKCSASFLAPRLLSEEYIHEMFVQIQTQNLTLFSFLAVVQKPIRSASPGRMDTEKMSPFLPSTPANLRSAASPWHVYQLGLS